MGKAARVKGASFERQVAIYLRKIDKTARRNVQESQVASVDILTELPLAIQCKCLKDWSKRPHDIWNQAHQGRLKEDDMPVGIVKIDRKYPELAIIALDDFLSMIEKLYGKKDETP